MVPIICVLNHEQISWVSIEIYYHDNFVFGHIFMFVTSIFAHFCILCTYLVGKQQGAYGESAGSASTTQTPYMGQLLKTGFSSLFSALLVPFATFH